jgi:twitching motility protein PilT
MSESESSTVPAKLRGWLEGAVDLQASDLHLIVGYPPVIRLNGSLTPLPDPPLTAEETEPLLLSVCPPDSLARLHENKNTDFSFGIHIGRQLTRFRASYFNSGQQLGACFRLIPNEIPDFEWAGFPPQLAARVSRLRDGLVIVTGPTGSGKTTTLAMIVQKLNSEGGCRIITVEEPVEYIFPREPNSVVTQREVGVDVLNFSDGLKYGLRQDPDAILVGEIRDRDTAQMALSAAETGHLVFTTLHTRDSKGAISRFADFFPQESQSTIRGQLAMSLRSILSQRLLPGVEKGAKRHLAIEVLWNTHPIASAIRMNKLESIDNYLLTGREDGMISFDESVRQLFRAGKITKRIAEDNVNDVMILKKM